MSKIRHPKKGASNVKYSTFDGGQYRIKIESNLFAHLYLIYDTTEGQRSKQITAGAAQGSILSPDLWNVSYDDILRMGMPDDAYLTGYADEVLAVMAARTTEKLQWKLNQVTRRVSTWMDDHGLNLAMEKTELVLITKKHIPTQIPMQVGSTMITAKPAIKHLGIWMDNRISFGEHIKQTSNKAASVTMALTKADSWPT